ncbi:MAG TPA: hypothetical protein VFI54_02315 [Solirubrobacteraceae bacterium]|nr:hypothetical protein [Solirubrobacteraceae bacterium]
MPVLVVVEVPGGSSALDEALIQAWHVTGSPPPGNRLRIAGPMDGGWRIVSLWDSAEQFQDFLRERLHLTLDDIGDGQPTINVWEVETVHTFG